MPTWHYSCLVGKYRGHGTQPRGNGEYIPLRLWVRLLPSPPKEGRKHSEVRLMGKTSLHCSEGQEHTANDHPVSETAAVKNPFCRRSGINRRSGRGRRVSVDSTKYHVDQRNSVDRRKGQDRRRHDYWNSNYRYYHGNL